MNTSIKQFLLSLFLITNTQAMHDVTGDVGPSERTAESSQHYGHKRPKRKYQSTLAHKEEETEEKSAEFGATQPDSESDSPEGYLQGESN